MTTVLANAMSKRPYILADRMVTVFVQFTAHKLFDQKLFKSSCETMAYTWSGDALNVKDREEYEEKFFAILKDPEGYSSQVNEGVKILRAFLNLKTHYFLLMTSEGIWVLNDGELQIVVHFAANGTGADFIVPMLQYTEDIALMSHIVTNSDPMSGSETGVFDVVYQDELKKWRDL